jgi:hypothetical protein
MRCRSSVRFVSSLGVIALCLAPAAAAKFSVSLSVSTTHPHVGQTVEVVIRTGEPTMGACRMRLAAIAPGASRQTALDALINGGTTTMGTTGPVFHRLRATPNLGLAVLTRRTSAVTWRADIRFPHGGAWQLVVPNWCEPGYASPLPAVRALVVR